LAIKMFKEMPLPQFVSLSYFSATWRWT